MSVAIANLDLVKRIVRPELGRPLGPRVRSEVWHSLCGIPSLHMQDAQPTVCKWTRRGGGTVVAWPIRGMRQINNSCVQCNPVREDGGQGGVAEDPED